jgi:hypothetical protein
MSVRQEEYFPMGHFVSSIPVRIIPSMLQDDPIVELIKGIDHNFSKYRLYRATTKPLVLPCPNVTEWLTRKVGHERRTLLDFKRKHIASYQDHVPNQMYHFKEARIKVTQELLQNKSDSINYLDIMKGWWLKGILRSNLVPTGCKNLKL